VGELDCVGVPLVDALGIVDGSMPALCMPQPIRINRPTYAAIASGIITSLCAFNQTIGCVNLRNTLLQSKTVDAARVLSSTCKCT